MQARSWFLIFLGALLKTPRFCLQIRSFRVKILKWTQKNLIKFLAIGEPNKNKNLVCHTYILPWDPHQIFWLIVFLKRSLSFYTKPGSIQPRQKMIKIGKSKLYGLRGMISILFPVRERTRRKSNRLKNAFERLLQVSYYKELKPKWQRKNPYFFQISVVWKYLHRKTKKFSSQSFHLLKILNLYMVMIS